MSLINTLQEKPKNFKLVYFIIGILGSLLCQILFGNYEGGMDEYSIIAFEFAWTREQMDIILASWKPTLDDAITFEWIDMAFPIFYAMLFSGWALLLTKEENSLVRRSVISIFVAAGCDYIENIASFVILYNPGTYASFLPFIVSLFASIKFLLIVVSLVINIVLSFKLVKN